MGSTHGKVKKHCSSSRTFEKTYPNRKMKFVHLVSNKDNCKEIFLIIRTDFPNSFAMVVAKAGPDVSHQSSEMASLPRPAEAWCLPELNFPKLYLQDKMHLRPRSLYHRGKLCVAGNLSHKKCF